MKKTDKAKNYFDELRRLINQCPKGYKLCYDNDRCRVYMCPINGEFNHGSGNGVGSAGLITVGGNYTPRKSDYDGNMVVIDSDGIFINLEAVSINAKEEPK